MKNIGNKRKIDKLDLSKILKTFVHQRHCEQRQSMEQEKIFANHTCDKRLLFRKYKELMSLNNKNNNKIQPKWENDVKRRFSKEDNRSSQELERRRE